MEATFSRLHHRPLEIAAADWLRATRRLALALLRAAGNAVVDYSRAGLLVRSGSRQRRRF